MSQIQTAEQAVVKKIAWRLMPLLVVMFLIAFIDRQNVGFAKLQMVHALGMSEASYGLGASLFFIGYLLFEVPSTLALHRFGARLWLARIMVTWGAITIAMAFTRSMELFYVFRFALGVAEAGFYPGVIFYLTLWFPQSHRTRMLGFFTLGSALANMLGSLAGGLLLSLDGNLGLAGWQWVFVATGAPAIVVALVALRFLPESVERAPFLSDEEKDVIVTALRREAPTQAVAEHPWRALVDRRVLMFACGYMLMSTSLYGVTYWLPTLLKSGGVSHSSLNGLLNMIPWMLAALLLLWLPAKLKREGVVLKAMAMVAGIGVIGFALSLVLPGLPLRFAALVLGGACIPLLYPCFWSLPPRYFAGARAAASIAAINSIGNLGGFFAQNLMPYVGKAAGNASAPMLVPVVCLTLLGLGMSIASARSGSGARVRVTARQ
ncbi:Major Facilitator Superfamily protein [Paraburkholderia diazotrophica]|uniref:Major Facilitator Superfamily protein n=2 Tax=Paraburkholderia diazotrophica TaxID=667676 RepID=A0A1H7EAV0_9BURK|nr:MFS transporter [Paraburkholderia diazotrophica]SEK11041.1 Major Facilitator Superfamily protein [Paraburkholderia diazotrophica]